MHGTSKIIDTFETYQAPKGPRHRRVRPRVGPRRAMAWWPRSPTASPVWTSCSPRNIIDGAIRFVRFREYFQNNFSETKNSRKQELALWHLVNRLVPENA